MPRSPRRQAGAPTNVAQENAAQLARLLVLVEGLKAELRALQRSVAAMAAAPEAARAGGWLLL